MQPAFRSIFRCYLLSPFVTLSAGVGLSFKRVAAVSRACTIRVSPPMASRIRSRVSLQHFAMWTLRLTTRSFGRPRKLSRSGNPRRGIYSTLGRAGSGDAAFLVMRDPKDEERILFLTAKNNLGKDPGRRKKSRASIAPAVPRASNGLRRMRLPEVRHERDRCGGTRLRGRRSLSAWARRRPR